MSLSKEHTPHDISAKKAAESPENDPQIDHTTTPEKDQTTIHLKLDYPEEDDKWGEQFHGIMDEIFEHDPSMKITPTTMLTKRNTFPPIIYEDGRLPHKNKLMRYFRQTYYGQSNNRRSRIKFSITTTAATTFANWRNKQLIEAMKNYGAWIKEDRIGDNAGGSAGWLLRCHPTWSWNDGLPELLEKEVEKALGHHVPLEIQRRKKQATITVKQYEDYAKAYNKTAKPTEKIDLSFTLDWEEKDIEATIIEVSCSLKERQFVQQALLNSTKDRALGIYKFVSFGTMDDDPNLRAFSILKQKEYFDKTKLISITGIPRSIMHGACSAGLDYLGIGDDETENEEMEDILEETEARSDEGTQETTMKAYYKKHPDRMTLYKFLEIQRFEGRALFNEVAQTYETDEKGRWNFILPKTHREAARNWLDIYLLNAVNQCNTGEQLTLYRDDWVAQRVQARMRNAAQNIAQLPLGNARPDPTNHQQAAAMLPTDAPQGRANESAAENIERRHGDSTAVQMQDMVNQLQAARDAISEIKESKAKSKLEEAPTTADRLTKLEDQVQTLVATLTVTTKPESKAATADETDLDQLVENKVTASIGKMKTEIVDAINTNFDEKKANDDAAQAAREENTANLNKEWKEAQERKWTTWKTEHEQGQNKWREDFLLAMKTLYLETTKTDSTNPTAPKASSAPTKNSDDTQSTQDTLRRSHSQEAEALENPPPPAKQQKTADTPHTLTGRKAAPTSTPTADASDDGDDMMIDIPLNDDNPLHMASEKAEAAAEPTATTNLETPGQRAGGSS